VIGETRLREHPFFVLVLFQAAHRRSEETMQANYFDSMNLGTITNGQGSMNAVEGMHRAALRAFVLKFARRLSLRLGAWRALSMKRMPAATMATPIAATCPSYSASRCQLFQRQQRWVPGVVVVDAGTVGVC
jgi:hypothetical protein